MLRKISYIIISVLFFVSLYIASGSILLLKHQDDNIAKFFKLSKAIKLGLDISGGSQLLLSVDFKDLMEQKYSSIASDIGIILNDYSNKNIIVSNNNIIINTNKTLHYNKNDIKRFIGKIDDNLVVHFNDNNIIIQYDQKYTKDLLTKTIDRSIDIIRNRIDNLGTKDINIQRVGLDTIMLEVPSIDDPEQIKKVLGHVAKMSFHLLDPIEPFLNELPSYIENDVIVIPNFYPGNRVLYYKIKKKIEINGDAILDARLNVDKFKPSVIFKLNRDGTRRFAEISTNNIGKPFAVVMDNKVLTAPIIGEPILNGSCSLTGNFSYDDAQNLANLIRSGALPAQLKIIGERTIGPTLGGDIMNSAKYAFIFGIGIMFIFMILQYRVLGIIADFSILYNLLLVLSIMSIFDITLTLPGIAGLILMLGMAVDANVLIHERMRDEVIHGTKNQKKIISAGFAGSTAAIIDSNLTTIFSAASLMAVSGGFVKGFAVTLIYGILCSLFTSMVVTKMIINTISNYINIAPKIKEKIMKLSNT